MSERAMSHGERSSMNKQAFGFVVAMLVIETAAFASSRAEVVSTGRRFDLKKALRPEGTTVVLFVQDTSAMEQQFLEELEKQLPSSDKVALRVVKLKNVDAPAAQQCDIKATPTAIVYDRFGRELGRSSSPDEIKAAVRKGQLMARIAWIDEDHPKAAETYGFPSGMRPPGQLPGIVKTMSLKPDAFAMFRTMSQIHFSNGFLTRREHELIGAYVSALNKCKF